MSKEIQSFIRTNRREILFIAAGSLCVLAMAILVSFREDRGYVPQEFLQARESAGSYSREIVDLSNQSVEALGQIAAKDEEGNYAVALSIAQDQAGRFAKLKDTAVQLSGQLSQMAIYLDQIRPIEAKDIGKEAIELNIKMVERLVVYINLNNQLIDVIEKRLSGKDELAGEIQKLVSQINGEVNTINSSSERHKELMSRLNDLTGIE
ncbi:MAG: hypothetical protein A2Y84_02075 [Candidatus Colwellbacteria bacterium RBG_13_48_8]|uniref:DUF5667 domain-containing protein n=1 Tax=Candidatus Colwellbacteria bacterium RBG_13_48_8 TaxID=1797685 RepID=A0A1G1YWD5_9BACT|nr:MAG: hypothetical protein A2Y84_02075 [Candidatus Colwellbacteria bacterium RBG_13_48_8]